MAAQRGAHPAAEVLRAFGLGKLDDCSSAAVLGHVESCDDCRREVTALTGDDFLARLRQTRGPDGTPAPARSLAGVTVEVRPRAGPAPVPDLPAELAGHPQYDVLRELGRGGMGVVYLARNKLLDRLEVLKVVNKALLDHPGAVERFLREIRSAARLSHANVVAAYSALRQGELLAFAMEYVEGQDLAALVKAQGPLPVPYACFYTQQAAWGLQHAFEKDMVHRDIKPQNLILAREGRKHIVKVLDFGLAKATREKADDPGLTGEGRMMGTPDYIAPEQTLDAASADIRADVYSLGCTLYFLLAGRPPFCGKSLGAVVFAHQTQEAEPLNRIRPDVPEGLAAVVRRMMAKSPDQRYQTPLEVVQALKPFVKQGGTSTSGPGMPAGTADTKEAKVGPAPTLMEAGAKERPRPPEARAVSVRPPAGWAGARRKGLVVVGLAVAVVLLALAGMWAGGVFKVKTRDGTIVLENLPPEADVTVDGEKVTLRTADGNTFTIQIAPGRKRRLQVKKEGFTTFGEEVEIEAGGRRTLTVLLEPLPPPADLDRQVAEWVLARKGTVQVRRKGEKKEREVGPDAKLPAERFELVEIKLVGQPVGNAGLARFKGLAHLDRLIVWNTGVTDDGLAHVQGLTSLSFLGLFANPKVTDAGLVHLARLTNLRNLDLNGTGVTDAGMVHLKGLASLDALNLMGTRTTGAGFVHIEGLANLQGLYLAGSWVGDEGCVPAGKMSKLTVLGLDGTRVTDAGLAHLGKLNKLTSLALQNTPVTDAGLARLKGLRGLRDLHLNRTKVTKAGVADIQKALPDCRIHSDFEAEALRPGSVWRGKRTYRKGAWEGGTVTYEVHVVSRDGSKFKGFKFDNGPGRNRFDFEGEINGNVLTWRETMLSFKGTLDGDTLRVTFQGPVGNGWTTEGDGELKREK